ncbi:hypothetical protein C2G38_725592 [Gigaspora rosea]|uniref:DEK-C domain-containing protein n=1 Tax=Gigaspora rosea TaxID=44941 RepID=A0A397U9G6_9GLOM|nr:hypothetical protein C2G38_725592 [Gigaspora rosea]
MRKSPMLLFSFMPMIFFLKLDKGPKKIHTVYREMATRNKRNADVELDEIMLKKTCKTIVHSADLETITIKQVRRDAEVKLGLTAKFLDKQPWKDLIHEFVTEAIEKSKSEDVSVVYSSRSKSVKVELIVLKIFKEGFNSV